MGHNVFHAVLFDKPSSRTVDFKMHYFNGNDVNNLTKTAILVLILYVSCSVENY